jgi:Dolichyl-phosphate-mannose-protein mannosyltransferase
LENTPIPYVETQRAGPSRARQPLGRLPAGIWLGGVALLFLGLMVLFFPFRQKFEYSKDEGVNLMKAMLVERGYRLYDDIWSDQPPLFTMLLTGVFKVLGEKVNAARLLVLLLSAGLLWAGSLFLWKTWGPLHALAGVLLLCLLPWYLMLSAAVMVGLPSLAFAMFSLLALAYWHQKRRSLFLVLSGLALALSVHTKIFTGFLAPIFLVGLLIEEYARMRPSGLHLRGLLTPAFIWGLTFGAVIAAVGLLWVGPGNLWQLIEPHLAASGATDYQIERYTLAWNLQMARSILFLALIGTAFVLLTKRWLSLYLVAWMGVAALLLADHAPVWFHQQLLVTVPAALLAGVAAGEALTRPFHILRSRRWLSLESLVTVVALVGLAFTLVQRTPLVLNDLRYQEDLDTAELRVVPYKLKFLDQMNQYAPLTKWVVTDMPMYPFRARLLVPPNLATFTSKRWETGNLSEADMIDAVGRYDPEMVLIGRFAYPELEQYLQQSYRLARDRANIRLYIRDDLPELVEEP